MKTKRTQKSISLIVVLATILSCFTFLALPVSAANNSDYNVNNAIEYATKHWNDGKGLCAEFVSDCLRAGGFTSVYEVNAKRLGEKLQQYGTKINCHTWSSKSYLTSNSFDMPLSKGDVIIWVNKNGSSSSRFSRSCFGGCCRKENQGKNLLSHLFGQKAYQQYKNKPVHRKKL